MSNILVRTAIVVVFLATLAFGTGVLLGPDWGWSLLTLALLVLLLHHVRHLHQLGRWASRSLAESVPEGTGAWEEIFTLLYRRQRAEIEQRRKLAHSLARSRQAGRALPYGVAILDAESRIVWCNDSCGSHFGIDPEADVGQPITYLVREPEFVEYVAAEDFSKPMQLKTGREGLVLSVQFVPYVDSQRLLLSRDITQGIRLETMR
ncbi:MAG TPA: phosphate regulon sensor protein PhoR, partial [Burkholderiales bacterium]|nr:phosphate regulon sensor protein PhoR [Burkholderiales bacterium]